MWAGKNSVLLGKDTSSMGKRFLTFQKNVLPSSSRVYGVLSKKNGILSSTSNQASKPASASMDRHNFEFGLTQLHYFKLCYKLLNGQAWSTVRDGDLRLRKEFKNTMFRLIHVVRTTSNTKRVYSPVSNAVRTPSSAKKCSTSVGCTTSCPLVLAVALSCVPSANPGTSFPYGSPYSGIANLNTELKQYRLCDCWVW